MRDGPPADLIDLLTRLRLATPEEVRAVRGRARRLARDLPLFESVWVDALAQSRVLTPYQAAEINAGRGDRLSVGPYVVRRFLMPASYADLFEAVEIGTRRAVHLVIARGLDADAAQAAAEILQAIAERFESVGPVAVSRLEAAGATEAAVWAAYLPSPGIAAQQWLSYQGRFPPMVALEIARQMAAALAALEAAGLVHGDIASSSLNLTESGVANLSRAAVRCALRPEEASCADRLTPEALDCMAPERLAASGNPPTTAGDIFACGLLWWHLLTGRPPRTGGNVHEKLIAAHRGKLPDVRRLAPDTPTALAVAIERCTQADPQRRPGSFAELTELLGPSTEAGRRRLAAVLIGSGRRTLPRPLTARVHLGLEKAGSHLAAAAACALLIAAASWPLWRSQDASERRMSRREHAPNLLVESSSAKSSTSQKRNPIVSADRAAATNLTAPSESPSATQAVRQANYQTRDREPATKPVSAPAARVIELPAGKEIPASTLRLTPGALVRGGGGSRTIIAAPPAGLVLTTDDVRFENIDFVWRQRPEAVTTPDRQAIVDMRCARATFVGCTFQATPVAGFEPPPAIVLSGRAEYTAALPPAGHVQLERCAIAHVACGIDCRLAGPAAVEVRNTLHAGEGPLVRFAEARRPDAPAMVSMSHVTVRGASSIVELHADDSPEGTSAITLTTTACIFAPREDGSLLVFSGQRPPRTLLKALEWLGQGSLATPQSAVARWSGSRDGEALAEDELSIDGLVFSKVEFEGEAADDPAASHVRRWLAPGRSDEPPGIGAGLPKLKPIQPQIVAEKPQQAAFRVQK